MSGVGSVSYAGGHRGDHGLQQTDQDGGVVWDSRQRDGLLSRLRLCHHSFLAHHGRLRAKHTRGMITSELRVPNLDGAEKIGTPFELAEASAPAVALPKGIPVTGFCPKHSRGKFHQRMHTS